MEESKMKNVKNLIKVCPIALMAFSMFSCQNEISNKVTDEETINNVVNYSLEYRFFNPGTQISYNHMWEGTDTQNKFGPNFSKDNRLYTYLLNYGESTKHYYFVYVNKDKTQTLTDWVANYLKNTTKDNDCVFDEDKNIVDGKYLLGANKNGFDDFLVTYGNDFNQKMEIGGYKMALCLESKTVTIKKNASTKTDLNKKFSLFKRVTLKYDETMSSFTELKENVSDRDLTDVTFSYVGDRLETYPKSFENSNCFYAPKMGLDDTFNYKTVKVPVTDKGILLPRKENGYDLLDKNVELPITAEDVYENHKDEFLDAFLEYEENSSTGYAYFDTAKVLNILK